ncbi:hypothetical protein K502DRAFT_365289 [Neoconidiobolus thromboides FSU 785]|nr:hypothetical protein K502DRAFT_365289 [Neoconidiobolus thromboides FSU 785]
MAGLRNNEVILCSLEIAVGIILFIAGLMLLLFNLRLKAIVPRMCSFIVIGQGVLSLGFLIEPNIMYKGTNNLHLYMLIMSAIILGLLAIIATIYYKPIGRVCLAITAGFMTWFLIGQFINGIIVDFIIGSFISILFAIQIKRGGAPVEAIAYSAIGAFLVAKGISFLLEGSFRFITGNLKLPSNPYGHVCIFVPYVLEVVLTIGVGYYCYKKETINHFNSEMKKQDLKRSPSYKPIE